MFEQFLHTNMNYEIFFVHTYVTYKNVIWPNLRNTLKYVI